MTLIRNSKQVRQTIDFTGIKDGKIHPTDIDVVLEFNNKALILMEVKRINNKIPIGQRLVLERICNNWRTSKSIALYVTHNFKQDELDIPLQKCFVSGYYYNKKWYDVKEEPLKLFLSKVSKKWNINKFKI